MAQSTNRLRRLLLLLIVLLLCSIAYLALQFSIYYEGGWQLVQGAKSGQDRANQQSFNLQVPEKGVYPATNWDIVRGGRLFLKPLPAPVPIPVPVDVQPTVPQIQPVETTPVEPVKPEQPEPQPVEKPKPTCPYVLKGIMLAKDKAPTSATAILLNEQTQTSQTVRKGTRLGDFEVIEIGKDFVLVKLGEIEFKLELGGK